MLDKANVLEVCEDYPAFRRVWKVVSKRREWHRLQLLSKLRSSQSHHILAAKIIQDFWLARQRNGSKEKPSVVRCISQTRLQKTQSLSLQKANTSVDSERCLSANEVSSLRLEIEAVSSQVAELQSMMKVLMKELSNASVNQSDTLV